MSRALLASAGVVMDAGGTDSTGSGTRRSEHRCSMQRSLRPGGFGRHCVHAERYPERLHMYWRALYQPPHELPPGTAMQRGVRGGRNWPNRLHTRWRVCLHLPGRSIRLTVPQGGRARASRQGPPGCGAVARWWNWTGLNAAWAVTVANRAAPDGWTGCMSTASWSPTPTTVPVGARVVRAALRQSRDASGRGDRWSSRCRTTRPMRTARATARASQRVAPTVTQTAMLTAATLLDVPNDLTVARRPA